MPPKYVWSSLSPEETLIIRALSPGEYLTLRYDVVRMFKGDATAAVLFSELLAWSASKSAQEKDGWFFQTSTQVFEKLGIQKKAKMRVTKDLVGRGFLEVEKKGLPAKNYYRINLSNVLQELKMVNNLWCPNGTQEVTLEVPPVVPSEDHREYLGEYPREDNIVASVPSRRNARINVLDNGMYDGTPGHDTTWFVTGIVKTYPKNRAGIGATPEHVQQWVAKTANLPYNAPTEKQTAACQTLNSFRVATKNYAQAVQLKLIDVDYVMSFESFSGTNRSHTYVPGYKKWIDWKPPVKKRELVAV